MREVLIADVGVVTAAGNSLDATWNTIRSGKTAIHEIDRFPIKTYRSRMGGAIPGIKPSGAGSMTGLVLKRLLDQIERIPRDSMIVTATTKAGIDNLEKMKRGLPFEAYDILPYSIGEKVAAKLGATGCTWNVSAACASSTVAVAEGAAMVAYGKAESVLVCCIDVLTEFIFSGFSALQILSPVPCMPFDRGRTGLSPGEGAAFLLLMNPDCARRGDYSAEYIVVGSGISNDAFHITVPDINGRGLVRAVEKAIKAARIGKDEIGGISAHGTGTIHNDLMELNAFRTAFGSACPPLYSIKGCVGHTFGASGGIELAVATRVIAEQTIPPTIGCRNPEPGAEEIVSLSSRPMQGKYMLVTNSGFGGINAAVILKRRILQ
ncbi:MAG: beta-ketoacyl-[acyl-carrier-protein] synthase family protein [Syntrophobacterales bacterium]|nr:beta-ketoacyl-[acyl-carrier-protein] synthase family protein [Syntrophobacterales bacterium]